MSDTISDTISDATLRLLIHAPTAAALARARRNALNLLKARPEAQVRLIVNGEAAGAALDQPDPGTDHLLQFCGNSLATLQRDLPDGLCRVEAAVLEIAEAQARGWAYMRA